MYALTLCRCARSNCTRITKIKTHCSVLILKQKQKLCIFNQQFQQHYNDYRLFVVIGTYKINFS